MGTKRLERLQENVLLPGFGEALAHLRQQAEEGSLIQYEIGPDERGEWTHYYHCHEDGARLAFDWQRPHAHRCPKCGLEYTGEPFNSAWTSIVHTRIGRAVYHAALLHAVEPDAGWVDLVKSYLLAYAEHYEGYQVHGDIPYNGPGKLFAQTLDEAHWILDLALGYGWIRDGLESEERSRIEEGLLGACARFLIAHKEQQIHNHSVLITSAIATFGILLGDESVVKAGLEGEYGLYDQIARGVLEDGLWYEGNVQYHFYAFKSLLHYAMVAEGTAFEIWQHPALKKMFDFPLNLVMRNGLMPTLNDAGLGDGIGSYAPFYEIALDIYGDEVYRELLNTAYGTVSRISDFALLFGRELSGGEPAGEGLWEIANRSGSFAASGLTKVVRGNGWHVLAKHSTFGGEHDHMDRLGLSVHYGDVPIIIDPGTTAYGVPAHYGWFKHTYSHNTVSIDGADQPPRDGQLLQYKEHPWGIVLEMAVDWLGDDYRMKDRIILPAELCPWDEGAYRGAAIKRINVVADDHLLDIVYVTVPEQREVHLLNHFSGQLVEDGAWLSAEDERLGRLDQKWLKQKRKLVEGSREFRLEVAEGVLGYACWSSTPAELFTALTPDNPPDKSRTSLIQRASVEGSVLFVQAMTYGQGEIGLQVVELADGSYTIKLKEYNYSLVQEVRDGHGQTFRIFKLLGNQ